MNASTIELMDRGMRCLADHLGDVEAERFIAVIMRERFDYTTWRRQRFADISSHDFNAAAAAFAATLENDEGRLI